MKNTCIIETHIGQGEEVLNLVKEMLLTQLLDDKLLSKEAYDEAYRTYVFARVRRSWVKRLFKNEDGVNFVITKLPEENLQDET